MCGIVGYIGKKQAKDILLSGLQSLSYRGYDSSGIALKDDDSILLVKSEGKLENLEAKIQSFYNTPALTADATSSEFNKLVNERAKDLLDKATIGIGHTRWATHGKPNTTNSHPHQDEIEDITIVHNGIIKNFFDLKAKLEADGFNFKTETDTEVVAQLIYKFKNSGKDLKSSLREALKLVEGSYAIAVLAQKENKIYLAKNQSPLVVGIGEGENYIASDSSTVVQYTNKILRLKDKQIAELTENNVEVEDLEGNSIAIQIVKSTQTASIMEKGQYKHFLEKEIHEQPGVISKMIADAFSDNQVKAFENLNFNFKDINKITFVACGSAYHAALVGKNIIEHWAQIPVDVAIASEFCSKPALVTKNDLVIGISQSGETADTLAAIKNASSKNANIMAITNKDDSAIYDLCTPNNYVTPAGIEVSVASTKAFTSQVLAMYFLAMKICQDRELEFDFEKNIFELRSLPVIIEECIEREEQYKSQMLKYSNYRDFLFLSRGVNYPIALEGALKLKELSYIHATGYPSGEMKHGPIAILDNTVPVLNIAISGKTEFEETIYKKTLSNAEEAKARMSPSLVIACDNDENVENLFDDVIRIPDISQLFSPIIATIPLQFLAYFIAENLGKDVDQPRNLAKSVTVE
jgi:glucosamine--fructose-6-phosphate aminotransferase (isomerizing)